MASSEPKKLIDLSVEAPPNPETTDMGGPGRKTKCIECVNTSNTNNSDPSQGPDC
jgi:hypothetical protein